jgi:hypothetical protein
VPYELRDARTTADSAQAAQADRETMSANDVLRATEIAIDALKMIQALTRVGPDKALDALQTISAIIATVQEGLDGKTTPDVVEAELKALAGDTTIADKFDNSGD